MQIFSLKSQNKSQNLSKIGLKTEDNNFFKNLSETVFAEVFSPKHYSPKHFAYNVTRLSEINGNLGMVVKSFETLSLDTSVTVKRF